MLIMHCTYSVSDVLVNFELASYTVSEDEGMGRIAVVISNRPLQDTEVQLIASKGKSFADYMGAGPRGQGRGAGSRGAGG